MVYYFLHGLCTENKQPTRSIVMSRRPLARFKLYDYAAFCPQDSKIHTFIKCTSTSSFAVKAYNFSFFLRLKKLHFFINIISSYYINDKK